MPLRALKAAFDGLDSSDLVIGLAVAGVFVGALLKADLGTALLAVSMTTLALVGFFALMAR